jgi:D-cysteine desulfhydrase
MPPSLPIPRVELALAPTPLLPLERLSRELGVELWVKRDDLTGLLESGNKVRKLEFLVGEALAHGADTLVHCGALQSNSCRTVAAVAARLGLRAVLALKGAPPDAPDGNLLLDHLLGADVHYIDDARWATIDETLEDLAADVRARGGAPYIIPEGGASVVGALGYLTCAEEIAAQIRHGAPEFDAIVIAAVSGGSQAGLLMGRQLTRLASRIVGVPIVEDGSRIRGYVRDVIERAAQKYGLPVTPPTDIELIDGCQSGEGGPEEIDVLVHVARSEGIVLDPIYTAKAFAGLCTAIRREPGRFGRRICFIHTGGIFSLFPFRDVIERATRAPRQRW